MNWPSSSSATMAGMSSSSQHSCLMPLMSKWESFSSRDWSGKKPYSSSRIPLNFFSLALSPLLTPSSAAFSNRAVKESFIKETLERSSEKKSFGSYFSCSYITGTSFMISSPDRGSSWRRADPLQQRRLKSRFQCSKLSRFSPIKNEIKAYWSSPRRFEDPPASLTTSLRI